MPGMWRDVHVPPVSVTTGAWGEPLLQLGK
jgi:hypothetical protein